jgi:hypothetical protein
MDIVRASPTTTALMNTHWMCMARLPAQIFILGKDYHQTLLATIAPDQLPVEYGGTCDKCRRSVPGATDTSCVPWKTEAELTQ